MRSLARAVTALDPRLKLGVALVLGPCLWKMHVLAAAVCLVFFYLVVRPLAEGGTPARKMVLSLLTFVFFWVAIKVVLDAISHVPVEFMARDAAQLAIRLSALLLLGLALSLSSSARSLGLAVAWAVRPFVGGERAWRLALSLSLMIHFLPACLSTTARVREVVDLRCPDMRFFRRAMVVSLAVIRNLGQKTWNQTLAVAGRGLARPEAWESDFSWGRRDGVALLISAVAVLVMVFPGLWLNILPLAY